MRMLCSEARVDAHGCRTAISASRDYARLSHALGRCATRSSSSTTRRRSRARDARQGAPAQGGARPRPARRRLPAADAGARPLENRQQEIAAISRSLKALAKELNVPVIALVAARRAPGGARATTGRSSPTCASRAPSSRTPTSSSSSSARRCTPTRIERQPDAEGIAELIIGKQRNGPTGTVRLAFLKRVHALREPRPAAAITITSPTPAQVDWGRWR